MTKNFSLNSFVGGFMLGALLVAGWSLSGDFSLLPLSAYSIVSSGHSTNNDVKAAAPESGAIAVTDQSAGPQVVVESVTVPPPGVWVAVREVNGADLGNVLGAVRVNGPHSSVTVPLLRATVPGSSYAVELYRDDGNDVFDLSTDSVYVDFATGAPVIAYFTTAS